MRDKAFVSPNPDGNWRGSWVGGERASVVAPTQAEAISRMAEIARNRGNSQLFIQRPNGQIRDERTYGNDPRRTNG